MTMQGYRPHPIAPPGWLVGLEGAGIQRSREDPPFVTVVPVRGGNFEGHLEVPVEYRIDDYGSRAIRRRIGPCNLHGWMIRLGEPMMMPV